MEQGLNIENEELNIEEQEQNEMITPFSILSDGVSIDMKSLIRAFDQLEEMKSAKTSLGFSLEGNRYVEITLFNKHNTNSNILDGVYSWAEENENQELIDLMDRLAREKPYQCDEEEDEEENEVY